MEYLQGGELLDRVTKYGRLEERESAVIMKKIISAVEIIFR